MKVIKVGEKWTRKYRMDAGNNTVRIVGIDPNNLCIKDVRINGNLELMPRGRFLRYFEKLEYKAVDLSMDDLGHLRHCDIFNSSDGNECTCKRRKPNMRSK